MMRSGAARALALALACWLAGVRAQYYDTFTGRPTSARRVAQLRASNLIPWCAMEVKPCDPHEPRRIDLTCNNLKYPSFGAALTPFHRMLPPRYGAAGGLPVASSGNALPNARLLRTTLIPDSRMPNKVFTHMLTLFAVFSVADATTVHDTINYVASTRDCCTAGGESNPECIPVRVPDDDPYLRTSDVRCLNLTRSITYQRLGCAPKGQAGERISLAAPMLELSLLYGSAKALLDESRELEGGRFKEETDRGIVFPPSYNETLNMCLVNRLPEERRCHKTANIGANSLVGINMGSIWFFRLHNELARRLQEMNPCWDDERLFMAAREINIAIYLQIMYYEWAPLVLGYDYLVRNQVIFPNHLHVEDYDEDLEPKVSIEYVVASRWFHTLQEGRLNLYDKHGRRFGRVAAVDMTLRTGAMPYNGTLAGMTQGAFRQPCSAPGHTIDFEMGERSLGPLQRVSDVLTADIMKGRDMGLPPYAAYRELCRLPSARSFADLYHWMNTDQADTLSSLYEQPEDVELMTGILGEKPMPGAVVGPTLACIMAEQLLRWRRADRFWYERPERPQAFTKDQLREIRHMSLARVLCDHGDSVSAVQRNPFQLPGPGNEIIDCKAIKKMSLEPWRDASCNAGRVEHEHWSPY